MIRREKKKWQMRVKKKKNFCFKFYGGLKNIYIINRENDFCLI